MSSSRKVIGSTLALVTAGYVIGLMTAPRSGKKSRKILKKTADNSISEVEKQLKQMFNQTQDLIKRINSNKSVNTKLKQSKEALLKNQTKIKELLSTIHGNDAVDEDLSEAIKEAKRSLKSFASYLNK